VTQFNIGGAVWLDVKRMLLQTKCWIQCLQLRPSDQTDFACVTRPDEGLDAVTQVDETVPLTTATYLLKPLIQLLASMGYEPEQSMLAHPYDWRLPPGQMEARDASFSRLKQRIEGTVAIYKQRHPQSPIGGVMLVGHSLGNLYIQYFFNYLKNELGEKGMEQWAEEYVYCIFMGGAPFLGSVTAIKALLVGETMGLPPPYSESQSRDLHLTWGVFNWMFPSTPEHNLRHAAMNHGEADHPVQTTEVTLKNGTIVQFDNKIHGSDFFAQLNDPKMHGTQQIQEQWYESDPLIGGGSPIQAWTPPKGVDHLICAYGINVPTPVGYKFQQVENGEYQTTEVFWNDRGDIRSLQGEHVLPRGRRFLSRKSGDGTVSYYSLSWCHSWFGDGLVNITKYPAGRTYEADDVDTYFNVDVSDPDQLAKINEKRTPQGYNTLFLQKQEHVNAKTGLPSMKSIQVWEMDGVTHKDTVTDIRVTRLIQWTLLKMEAWSHAVMETHERYIAMMREELRLNSIVRSCWATEMVKQGIFFSRKDHPKTDNDCYWDYYNVACAWPRYCHYQYQMGDLHLGQSCRLRETPLHKDDPQLLLKDHDPLNDTFTVPGNTSADWRIVYRDRDRNTRFPPWFYVFVAFVGGGLAVLILLYVTFRCYRKKVLETLNTTSTGRE